MKAKPIQTQPSCGDPDEYGTQRFEDARQRILDAVLPVAGFERLALQEAAGRVLYLPIVSPIDVPQHTNSAVDGYAVRAADLPSTGQWADLEIVGTALAGRPYGRALRRGQTVRIMTGAPMPEGGDTVLMKEHVEVHGARLRLDARHRPGQNVRGAGEDVRAGQTVLHPGRRLTPADIGLIASVGLGEVDVTRKLTVAVASTGDEIHTMGQRLPEGGVYDSNRYALGAALGRLGVDVIDLGVVPDDEGALKRVFSEAARICDVIIASGGVSVGEADFTKSALASTGTVAFWKVAIKPGRPIAFGTIDGAVFFGLPGNPVAVMVTFYQFVLPALEKLMGVTNKPLAPTLKARCCDAIRKKAGRTEFQRGILEQDATGNWQVRSTGQQGSGILRSMSLANAFIILPHDSGPVAAGDLVTVQPFAGLI